jgi:AcrR family transcriptional regulator
MTETVDRGSRRAPGSHARKHRQHRRRGDLLEGALLDAAWEELQAVGYQALSMEAVAVRAGTSKAVLYRRWRNRAELVLAAMRRRRPMLSGPTPDTGSLRDDVLALLRRAYAGIAEIGQETMFGLLDELSGDPDGLAYLHAQQAGAEAMEAILRAAAARGEVRLDRIPPRVASLPTDLARHELLFRRTAVPGDVLAAIVDDVFMPLVHCVSRPT